MGWRCGFSPATHRGIRAEGTAADFAQARADLGRAWCELLPKITEGDFAQHRRERAMTAWKYEMWNAGYKLPTQLPELKSVCFCGAEIDVRGVPEHVYTEHLK